MFNPKYDEALEVDRAYIAWQNAERETFDYPYTQKPHYLYWYQQVMRQQRMKLKEIIMSREKLNSTKRTVLENVYSSYEVEKLKITASQNATLFAFIIDRNGKFLRKNIALMILKICRNKFASC